MDNDHVAAISGGTNYYPYYPDNNTIEEITELLKPFDEGEPYYQVSLRVMKEVLSHVIPSPDFKLASFNSILDAMLAETPAMQGILMFAEEEMSLRAPAHCCPQTTGNLVAPSPEK